MHIYRPEAEKGFINMKSTKLMQLGILVMLLGIGLVLGITQALYNLGVPFMILRAMPALGGIIIVVGFIIGVIGFMQKN